MKNKHPDFTIQMFTENVDHENLKCPRCNKKLSIIHKCLKCGSTNLIEDMRLD